MIIEGTIAVKAALLYRKREVKKIYVDQAKIQDKNFSYILQLAERRNVFSILVEKEDFEKYTSSGSHGGIIAEVGERKNDSLSLFEKQSIIFCLNGVEDPFNFAYCLRTLCALGFEAVLSENRRFFDSEATVLKSSAGAYDRVLLHGSEDLDKQIRYLKKKGYRVLALQRSDRSQDLYKIDFSGKVILLLGGERRGIRKSTLAYADEEIVIPYGSDFRNALNATSALALVAGEAFRQRRKHD